LIPINLQFSSINYDSYCINIHGKDDETAAESEKEKKKKGVKDKHQVVSNH